MPPTKETLEAVIQKRRYAVELLRAHPTHTLRQVNEAVAKKFGTTITIGHLGQLRHAVQLRMKNPEKYSHTELNARLSKPVAPETPPVTSGAAGQRDPRVPLGVEKVLEQLSDLLPGTDIQRIVVTAYPMSVVDDKGTRATRHKVNYQIEFRRVEIVSGELTTG